MNRQARFAKQQGQAHNVDQPQPQPQQQQQKKHPAGTGYTNMKHKSSYSATSERNAEVKSMSDYLRDKSEESVVRQAMDVGFLVYASREFVIAAFEAQSDYEPMSRSAHKKRSPFLLSLSVEEAAEERERDIRAQVERIRFLRLADVPIIELGCIPMCSYVRILCLENNFLFNIEPLSHCVHLQRLELQNNQV